MSGFTKPPIANLARGKWRGILLSLGFTEAVLKDRHGPCPMCGGKDRFRWDNKEGRGTYICGQCGSGDGFDLLMKSKGWAFTTAAKEVERLLGISAANDPTPKPELTDQQIRDMKNQLWRDSTHTVKGDIVDRYLCGRGLGAEEYPGAIHTCQSARMAVGKILPLMVAKVVGVDNSPVSLHRTFIEDGAVASRKMMPGPVARGSCIRLSDPAESIGIAEGIETALAVKVLFDVPCWAVISASMMKNWIAPDFVKHVTIYGDNDKHFAGQAAAFVKANGLASQKMDVSVEIPDRKGWDWDDYLQNQRAAA